MTDVNDIETVDELIAPIEAYLARAANRPINTPIERQFAEIEASLETAHIGAPALATATTFFCDISEFQPVVTAAYPYSVLSMRIDSGWRTDNHAAANWKFARSSAKIQVVICYVVCIPGQLDEVMGRAKKLLGAKCPAKVAFMIDMESGSGFAGHGNHSAEGNRWLAAFAAYAGNKKRVLAYANGYDFGSNWPQLASGYKKVMASYGSGAPGGTWWGWQYAGGDPKWGSRAGYPRSTPPFGSHVDFNVVLRSLTQVKSDLGITSAPAPAPKPKPAPKYKTYKVKKGDSLSGIAAKYHTNWKQLVSWNKAAHPSLASNPNAITIGWTLRVSK